MYRIQRIRCDRMILSPGASAEIETELVTGLMTRWLKSAVDMNTYNKQRSIGRCAKYKMDAMPCLDASTANSRACGMCGRSGNVLKSDKTSLTPSALHLT